MKHFYIFIFLIASNILAAQDIHFTNFQLAPMSLNPALTGSFHGTLRANGIYRDQNTYGYNSMMGGVEFNIPFALRKQDWISAGLEYVQDKERIIKSVNTLKVSQTNIAIAYHFAFDKKYKNVLTAAIQYKIMSSSFNKHGEYTRTDIAVDGSITSPSGSPTLQKIKQLDQDSKGKSLKDWVGAIALHSKFGKKSYTRFGFSFAHILGIDRSVLSQSSASKIDLLPMRITGFAQGEIFINQSMSLQPVVYFQFQSPFSEVALQTLFGIEINPEKNIKINPGLGYRLGDAAEFLFIMDYGKFKAGVSFDLTTSKYKSSEGIQNGLEFGLSYTTTIIKKPQVKPVIFCPRL